MCSKKSITNDKKIVLLYFIFFILSMYISMICKKINDIVYQDINTSNIISIIDSYINIIEKNKILYNIHFYMNKFNYIYIIIFLITSIWLFFYSKMVLKILKRYLIICSIYSIYNSILLVSTIYYRSYKYCDYIPEYYNLWGLFRCYTYKENFLLYCLIMLYIFNQYHTSSFIRISFIILNILNIYLSLVERQIYLNQVIETIVISFLFWALYDNPNYFKNSKKNDLTRENKKRKQIELEIQKSKLYENVININDF